MARRFKKSLRQLNEIAKELTGPLLDKQGFLSGSIIHDWSHIVGSDYGEMVFPERVSFSRGKNTGGTLFVSVVNSGVALLFDHAKAEILKRINTYYGYEALGDIRIKGTRFKKLEEVRAEVPLSSGEKEAIEAQLSHMEDGELKDILSHLGAAIALENKNNKGAKDD